MPLYLSPYIGKGTRANPFMPTGFDQPGASAIDLRADGGATLDGSGFPYALLWLPAGSVEDPAFIKLGERSDESFAVASKLILSSTVPTLDFTKDAILGDCLSTLLIAPPANGWKPLKPANGRLEAWLGSERGAQRWIDQPVLAGGSLTDSFNRANETPLASPWTILSGSTGTINLASNAITKFGNSDCFYYYAAAGGWNADQSSQFLYASLISGNEEFAPAVRIGSNGFSAYFYDQYNAGRVLLKYVAGAGTTLATVTGTPSVGTAYKLDVSGSTLRYYDGGSEHASSPATDTSLATAGNGAGVFIFDGGGSLDDWAGTGDITAGGGLFPPFEPRPNLVRL